MKKVKIGFDFDRVFANYPQFIPAALVEYLYKKKDRKLTYRFPGKLEQQIRQLSHITFFRPAIRENILALKKIYETEKFMIYLISSRFSFLQKRTETWNKKHKISSFFEKMYFNFNDEQPHIFKDKILKQENIEKFIDDDLDLLLYLAPKNPKIDFYWLSKYHTTKTLPKNITQINTLNDFLNSYV